MREGGVCCSGVTGKKKKLVLSLSATLGLSPKIIGVAMRSCTMCATTVAFKPERRSATNLICFRNNKYHVYYIMCKIVYSSESSSWKQEMATTSGVPNDIEDANKVRFRVVSSSP